MQLVRSTLVEPLEEAYRVVLDGIAKSRGWVTSAEVARAGLLVRKLSDAYNGPTAAPVRGDEALAARLVFSFARDVPKGAGAVRELVATGALAMPQDRPLRVLDVGAGLGATARGAVRALARAGGAGDVHVDAVDSDSLALDLASAITRARPTEGAINVELRTFRASAASPLPVQGPYDLVILGQVLSELDRDLGDARAQRHASLVQTLAQLVRPDGSLVVVEPALRERTRHLHVVRDLVLALPGVKLNVFAPCVHDSPCPILERPDAWCHEDLDVDLPPWLAPVARAAGLRWQGLTFSYLVLRRDERSQVPVADSAKPRHRLRVVSSPVVTKGKRELFLCGPFEGLPGAAQVKVMRLDRHRAPGNEAWDEAARGDVLTLTPAVPAARPRVEVATLVERASPPSRPD
jgi:SAM-dependent methyltransferase